MESTVSGSAERTVAQPLTEFQDRLVDWLKTGLNLEISLDELPPGGGLYAETGASQTVSSYYDKTALWTIPVLFLSKNADQKAGMENLSTICNFLHKRKSYPSGQSFAWKDAQTVTQPNKIGRDEDGKYLHSCIVNCKIYF